MKTSRNSFRHDSLQDSKSIQQLLGALSKGIKKGNIELSDEDSELLLAIKGLIAVKLTAEQEDGRNVLSLRLSWQDEDQLPPKKKKLKISSK